MHKTSLKIKKMSAIITFAQKTSEFFAVKNGVVFFINRMKLEKILSLLCLLGEFNEEFMEKECGNLTQWLKTKKLFTTELLYEISDFTTENLAQKI